MFGTFLCHTNSVIHLMYITLVYWNAANNVNYYPVPPEEVERTIKHYQRKGYKCAIYTPELIEQIKNSEK